MTAKTFRIVILVVAALALVFTVIGTPGELVYFPDAGNNCASWLSAWRYLQRCNSVNTITKIDDLQTTDYNKSRLKATAAMEILSIAFVLGIVVLSLLNVKSDAPVSSFRIISIVLAVLSAVTLGVAWGLPLELKDLGSKAAKSWGWALLIVAWCLVVIEIALLIVLQDKGASSSSSSAEPEDNNKAREVKPAAATSSEPPAPAKKAEEAPKPGTQTNPLTATKKEGDEVQVFKNDNSNDEEDEPAVYQEKPQPGPRKFNVAAIRGGKSESAVPRDQFGNAIGDQFDLVKDGAMRGFKILVGDFYGSTKKTDMEIVFNEGGFLRANLERKGFKVDYVKKLADFNAKFNPESYHAAIIICSSGRKGDTPAEVEYMEKMTKWYLAGRGMFMLGDSEPWNAEIDDCLRAVKGGFSMGGTTEGDGDHMRRLTKRQGTAVTQGTFRAHPITCGLRVIDDGNSICIPNADFDAVVAAGRWDIIGRSKKWNTPTLLASSDLGTAKGFGRLIIDCGFTKFFQANFEKTSGAARYFTNCAVYATGCADFAEFGPADPETGKCPLRAVNPTAEDLADFAGN
jgi:hypothetical protein